MGPAIRTHLEQGHDVHTLLCTTGENTGVRDDLGMTPAECTEARDDEYTRACRRLGVRFDNIHIAAGRVPDGQLSVEVAELLLADWLTEHPNAWVKTLSNLPVPGVRHNDHVHLGQAAVNLLASSMITPNGLRLYIEPYQLAEFDKATTVHWSTEQPRNVQVVRNALDEYAAKDAIGGKYGVGQQSVPSAFATVRSGLTSYWHVPS